MIPCIICKMLMIMYKYKCVELFSAYVSYLVVIVYKLSCNFSTRNVEQLVDDNK